MMSDFSTRPLSEKERQRGAELSDEAFAAEEKALIASGEAIPFPLQRVADFDERKERLKEALAEGQCAEKPDPAHTEPPEAPLCADDPVSAIETRARWLLDNIAKLRECPPEKVANELDDLQWWAGDLAEKIRKAEAEKNAPIPFTPETRLADFPNAWDNDGHYWRCSRCDRKNEGGFTYEEGEAALLKQRMEDEPATDDGEWVYHWGSCPARCERCGQLTAIYYHCSSILEDEDSE